MENPTAAAALCVTNSRRETGFPNEMSAWTFSFITPPGVIAYVPSASQFDDDTLNETGAFVGISFLELFKEQESTRSVSSMSPIAETIVTKDLKS
jgi:hypothetical protein